jgi:hypothetical protein
MTEDQRLKLESMADPARCALTLETIEAVAAGLNEIRRLRAINEELRFSLESLLVGWADLAPHAARARGILKTASEGRT